MVGSLVWLKGCCEDMHAQVCVCMCALPCLCKCVCICALQCVHIFVCSGVCAGGYLCVCVCVFIQMWRYFFAGGDGRAFLCPVQQVLRAAKLWQDGGLCPSGPGCVESCLVLWE